VAVAADASPRVALGAASTVVGVPSLDEISRQQSPRDRDVAAARLRSILTSAMDASRITAETGGPPGRSVARLPSPGGVVHPPDRRPPPPTGGRPTAWNKLPDMANTGTSPGGIPSASLQGPSFAADASKSPPTPVEPRLVGRLAPLTAPPGSQLSYSPRPQPLATAGSVPAQSNGMLSTFTGAGPRKPPSTYGNAK